ncbi:MAG: TRAP transporter substrate-binding protein DctP [Micrococcaceae bacterium]
MKIGRSKVAFAVGGVISLGLVLSGCSATQNDEYVLHYSTYSNATSDQSITMQRWADRVDELTDGKVSVEFHYSQSLVDADESVQALLDGRVDLAQVGSMYAASDLSMFTASELPFESQNPEAQMKALQRLYNENAAYREDFDRQGVRQLFPLPIGNAVLGSNSPIESVDDFRGKSIRSGGLISEILLAGGANPVSMTATDVYESMERGVVNGYTSLGMSNLPTFGLAGSTDYIADAGIGAYASSIVAINSDLYEDMPADYQDAVSQASEEALSMGIEELDREGQLACEQAREAGTEFHKWDDDATEEFQAKTSTADQWTDRYERRGYDAESVLTDYREFLREESAKSEYQDALTRCLEGEA